MASSKYVILGGGMVGGWHTLLLCIFRFHIRARGDDITHQLTY